MSERIFLRGASRALCGALVLAALSAAGAPPSTPDRRRGNAARDRQAEQAAEIDRLRAELADSSRRQTEQSAKLQELQEQLSRLADGLESERRLREEQRAAAAEAARPVPLPETPAVLAKRAGVWLSGFVQADFSTRSDQADEVDFSNGELLNQRKFAIRRARLRAEARYDSLGGAVELDANTLRGATARLIAAEASWRLANEEGAPALVEAAIGMFKTPFGYEILESDRDRLFAERSTAERALFPGEYDVGARLSGGWRFLRWSGAVMNGHPLGERGFAARSPSAAKDFVGRIAVTAPAGGFAVRGGLSALWGRGFHPGTPATKDVLVWRDLNEDNLVQLNELMFIPGQPATPSATFPHSAVGADLGFDLPWAPGNLALYGEVYWAKNLDRAVQPIDPIGAGRDLRQTGFYVAVVQDLGSLFQLGARYDAYQPDRDASEVKAGAVIPRDPSYSTLALAASVRKTGFGRLVFEYDRSSNALGRDLRGDPKTLGANAFLLRGQVEF